MLSPIYFPSPPFGVLDSSNGIFRENAAKTTVVHLWKYLLGVIMNMETEDANAIETED